MIKIEDERGGWWNVDRDAKRVGSAMLLALLIGAIFVIFSIQGNIRRDSATATGSQQATAQSGGTSGADAKPPAATGATTKENPAGDGTAAPKWAGLLWAGAWCAVGSFLGFIFGIPRSLSSDTARTVLPAQSTELERIKIKAAASEKAANSASAEKKAAEEAATTAATSVSKADTEVKEAETAAAAAAAPGDLTASRRPDRAREMFVEAQEKQQQAAQILTDKVRLAKATEEAAKKDRDALAKLAQPGSAVLPTADVWHGPSVTVNTNLEQISDWLTKIIVGVSLVNSEKIGTAMLKAAGKMSESLGTGTGNTSLSLAIMIYFSLVGLLGGYLLTRLFLQRAFNAVEANGKS